jgi:hypothetical protein
MSISERINHDNLNIHQFQETPEAKPPVEFDPDRDITQDQKQLIFGTLASESSLENFDDNELADYLIHLGRTRILWPQEHFLPQIDKMKALELFKKVMNFQFADTKLEGIAGLIAALPHIQFNLEREQLLRFAKKIIQFPNTKDVAAHASYLKMINPGNNLLEEMQPKLKKIYIDYLEFAKEDEDWTDFGIIAGTVKLIYPDFDPKLTPEDWSVLQNELKTKLNDTVSMGEGLELAVAMKILAAHKVEITAPGVISFEMQPPADLTESNPSLPEKRKF